MKLPDTAVVLRQTANPTQDHAAFDDRAREPLADYGSGFLARQFDGRPSVGGVELFDEQQGSAGAGQITYVLKLTNSSSAACSLSGFPQLLLLDANGSQLPTHAAPEPGAGAKTVTLKPGGSASYEARFSPDVSGTGDAPSGQCQPTASTLRVTPTGGGTVDAPIKPPTPVCEQGSLRLRSG